jgi:hypothetical protein
VQCAILFLEYDNIHALIELRHCFNPLITTLTTKSSSMKEPYMEERTHFEQMFTILFLMYSNLIPTNPNRMLFQLSTQCAMYNFLLNI